MHENFHFARWPWNLAYKGFLTSRTRTNWWKIHTMYNEGPTLLFSRIIQFCRLFKIQTTYNWGSTRRFTAKKPYIANFMDSGLIILKLDVWTLNYTSYEFLLIYLCFCCQKNPIDPISRSTGIVEIFVKSTCRPSFLNRRNFRLSNSCSAGFWEPNLGYLYFLGKISGFFKQTLHP